jgi:hypothetical protein
MKRKLDQGWTIDLNDQATLWQAPATDSFRSRGGDRKDEMGLDQQARLMWGTPTAGDDNSTATERPSRQATNRTTEYLSRQSLTWPTPAASVANDGESVETWEARRQRNLLTGNNGNGMGTPLTIAATAHFPTPAQRDYRDANAKPYSERGGGSKGEQLQNFIAHSFLQGQPTETRGPRSFPPARTLRRLSRASTCSVSTRLLLDTWTYRWWAARAKRSARPFVRPSLRKRLNSRFVDSLMSWPAGWSDALTPFDPAEMESWRFKALLHLSRYVGEPVSDSLLQRATNPAQEVCAC